MTRATYARMTGATRQVLSRLPGGARLLRLPTLLCAVAYVLACARLLLSRDPRLGRAALVPASCFLTATILRRAIGRERPYDRFHLPPVGRYTPGKQRSLPSRHAASAAAIALALIWLYPAPGMAAAMLALCLLIAALRVVSGHHYPSDVLAALLLSALLSLVGYCVL